jgi:hypothetical protein
VLQWAPAGTGTNAPFTTKYVHAGTTQRVSVTGAAPSEALCVTTPGGVKLRALANASGAADFSIPLGTKTANTVVTVSNATGVVDTATIKALAAKKLRITVKAKVRKGKVARIVVRGLAPSESVKVTLRGKAKSGHATRGGVFVAKLKVTGKLGKAKVAVRGEFANRKNVKTVRVVR